MALNAGALNRRVTFQSVATEPDSIYGGPVETASTLATRWARIRSLSMQERFAVGDMGTVTHEFTVRWDTTLDAALDSADQITYDGRTFDIRGVDDSDEAHVELKVLAEEKR